MTESVLCPTCTICRDSARRFLCRVANVGHPTPTNHITADCPACYCSRIWPAWGCDRARASTDRGHRRAAGLQEFEWTTTKGFEFLREMGIEAVLTARSVNGEDGTPESASVRVTDTANGQILAGITWQNGWGGQRGSVADRTMRKTLTQAANEIAQELLKRIQPLRDGLRPWRTRSIFHPTSAL